MTEIFRNCGLVMSFTSVFMLILSALADLACCVRLKNVCCFLSVVFGMSAAVFAGMIR